MYCLSLAISRCTVSRRQIEPRIEGLDHERLIVHVCSAVEPVGAQTSVNIVHVEEALALSEVINGNLWILRFVLYEFID